MRILVSVSSLNRHAVATREDVGTPKALCLKKHFLSIFPECHVNAKVMLYDSSSEEEILSGDPDFVLDCIDNIDTKVALLTACVQRGLKVLSATGAGARADPTRIRVADLRESINDPLSRAVRHRLRRDYGIEGGIPVVFSLEKPKAKLLPFKGPSAEEENPSDYQLSTLFFQLKKKISFFVIYYSYSCTKGLILNSFCGYEEFHIVPGFRVRIIPVLGTIPAIFGQVMASYIVTQLAGVQVNMEPVVNFDMDSYQVLHQRLIEHEELLYGTAMQVQVGSANSSVLSAHLGLHLNLSRRFCSLCKGKKKDHYMQYGVISWLSAEDSWCFVLNKLFGLNFEGAVQIPDFDENAHVDVQEVMYIAKELWHGRSARDQSPKDVGRGMWRSVNELMLVRWDCTKPASVSNLVLLRFKEADEHELRSLEDIKEKEPEFFSRNEKCLDRGLPLL
ncbi:unnamed protein product [Fraxinus pennsylvanica]|uniref:THIF-type NAD/FAD binding fold domain-containing protein n=1 Tax=Fraxinus pennsylvanica TaxID=56036 RepID=A0AAD1YYM9_9LAMI|nr:unnamed protein product [Fraxinus pennsylvanica]